MKTFMLFVALVALASFMASASFSAPSSVGPTGLLNIPTAEAVAAGSFEMQLAYDRPTVADVNIDVLPVATLTHGFANGEIGISYFNIKDYTAVKSANAKFILARQHSILPSIAAGAIYLSGDTAETDTYLVATYGFGLKDKYNATPSPNWAIQKSHGNNNETTDKIRVTGGLLYQIPSYSGASNNLAGIAGLELGSPKKTTVAFDYIYNDISGGNIWGAMIRQPITPNLTVQVGMGDGPRYFAGMVLKFGGK